MQNALTARQIDQVTSAIKLVTDTFFRAAVAINKRSTALDGNGEKTVTTSAPHETFCMWEYNVGLGGRYHTVDRTELGQVLRDEWKLYFNKADVDALGITVDPEADSITIHDLADKEFEIRMWAPSAEFSTAGMQLYECSLLFTPGA